MSKLHIVCSNDSVTAIRSCRTQYTVVPGSNQPSPYSLGLSIACIQIRWDKRRVLYMMARILPGFRDDTTLSTSTSTAIYSSSVSFTWYILLSCAIVPSRLTTPPCVTESSSLRSTARKATRTKFVSAGDSADQELPRATKLVNGTTCV